MSTQLLHTKIIIFSKYLLQIIAYKKTLVSKLIFIFCTILLISGAHMFAPLQKKSRGQDL